MPLAVSPALAIGSAASPLARAAPVAQTLFKQVDGQLMRNTLKMGVATLITASIASWTDRIEYVWYPTMAVVIVVDDNDDQTVKAATSRILGTVTGGLVTCMVYILVCVLSLLPLFALEEKWRQLHTSLGAIGRRCQC